MKSNFFAEFNNLYFFEFVLFYKLAHAQSDAISFRFCDHTSLY